MRLGYRGKKPIAKVQSGEDEEPNSMMTTSILINKFTNPRYVPQVKSYISAHIINVADIVMLASKKAPRFLIESDGCTATLPTDNVKSGNFL